MTRLTFDFPISPGGRARAPRENEGADLLVIADLSGDARAARTTEPGLAGARLVSIGVDNFERVMQTLRPEARVELGGTELRLTFTSPDDFHPDQLYGVLQSSGALERPQSARTSESDARAPRTAPAQVEDDASTLARLLGARPSSAHPSAAAAPETKLPTAVSALDAMLHQLVAPHIVRDSAATREGRSPGADLHAVSDAMRRVLHAPAFQRVEASWRALRWLVCENPMGADLRVHVLDASRADLLADLRACRGELERSDVYRLVVRERAAGPDGSPFSLIVGDLTCAGTEEDVSLLAGLGAVAAQAGGCFLAGADPVIWGASDLSSQPDRSRWSTPDAELTARLDMLRGSAVAPFIGLCAPRVLGRVPYGPKTDPVDRFDFTELTQNPAHADFLWLNSAFACAQLILDGVVERGWSAGPGTMLDLGDLPHVVLRTNQGDAAQACAEIYLDENSAGQMLAAGVMPFLSYRNRNAVRLMRLQSIANPPVALALGQNA